MLIFENGVSFHSSVPYFSPPEVFNFFHSCLFLYIIWIIQAINYIILIYKIYKWNKYI